MGVHGGAMGVHGGSIVRRVRALQGPPPVGSGRQMSLLAVVGFATMLLEATATADFVAVLRAWLIG
jgi:hypothetical protein